MHKNRVAALLGLVLVLSLASLSVSAVRRPSRRARSCDRTRTSARRRSWPG